MTTVAQAHAVNETLTSQILSYLSFPSHIFSNTSVSGGNLAFSFFTFRLRSQRLFFCSLVFTCVISACFRSRFALSAAFVRGPPDGIVMVVALMLSHRFLRCFSSLRAFIASCFSGFLRSLCSFLFVVVLFCHFSPLYGTEFSMFKLISYFWLLLALVAATSFTWHSCASTLLCVFALTSLWAWQSYWAGCFLVTDDPQRFGEYFLSFAISSSVHFFIVLAF